MHRNDINNQLGPAIEAQLAELSNANHCGAGSIVKAVERSELRARIASVDRLACECELLTVTDPRLGSQTTDGLQALADRLSEQLSYLEERLIVLEVDRVASQVQLRSQEPRVTAEVRSYFEVQVGKLAVTLQRFEKEPGRQRQSVPATLTRDLFCRVCTDLIASLHELA